MVAFLVKENTTTLQSLGEMKKISRLLANTANTCHVQRSSHYLITSILLVLYKQPPKVYYHDFPSDLTL